jgi:hypothetical protein
MNRILATAAALVAIALLAAPPAAYAARSTEAARLDSFYAQADIDLAWMKAAVKTLAAMLEQARRARDAKQINCIEGRLSEAQKIVAGSQNAWLRLKDAAAGEDFAVVEGESKRIHVDRKLVEDLMKLVTNCQTRIGQPGGFTEVTQQGEDSSDDPTQGEEDDGRPEPVPPGYEPPDEPSPSSD